MLSQGAEEIPDSENENPLTPEEIWRFVFAPLENIYEANNHFHFDFTSDYTSDINENPLTQLKIYAINLSDNMLKSSGKFKYYTYPSGFMELDRNNMIDKVEEIEVLESEMLLLNPKIKEALDPLNYTDLLILYSYYASDSRILDDMPTKTVETLINYLAQQYTLEFLEFSGKEGLTENLIRFKAREKDAIKAMEIHYDFVNLLGIRELSPDILEQLYILGFMLADIERDFKRIMNRKYAGDLKKLLAKIKENQRLAYTQISANYVAWQAFTSDKRLHLTAEAFLLKMNKTELAQNIATLVATQFSGHLYGSNTPEDKTAKVITSYIYLMLASESIKLEHALLAEGLLPISIPKDNEIEFHFSNN